MMSPTGSAIASSSRPPSYDAVCGERSPVRRSAQCRPTPLPDIPFAWLTKDEEQPVTINPNGNSSIAAPPNAIRVQPAAYLEFAPSPAFEANGAAHVPKYGTYLVRLVSNPLSAADPQRGWQVVTRLAP
jgi:hypothetical protein